MSSIATDQDLLHRLATSFGGVPAGQTWADFYLWELVLNANPHLRAIVEIGTWEGGFSRYLWAQAELRRMNFVTVDAVQPEREPHGFCRLDVFAKPGDLFEYFEEWEPLILLCDGGNKPREARTFGPMLGSDSLVVVHDWLTEFQEEDVPERLVAVYEDVCEEIGSMSRVFQPRGE